MKYVITGGPCTGKSAVVEELKRRGFKIMPEVARTIIEEELQKQKNNSSYKGILPWTNIELFERNILKRQEILETPIPKEITFLEGGMVDTGVYTERKGIDLWSEIEALLEKNNYTKIFFMQELPFYKQDEARRESKEEAKEIHDKKLECWKRFKFEIVEVPYMSVKERTDFIERNIKQG